MIRVYIFILGGNQRNTFLSIQGHYLIEGGIMDIKEYAISLLETALKDEIEFRNFEKLCNRPDLAEENNKKYSEAIHIAMHFIADRKIRNGDYDYDLFCRKSLSSELARIKEDK